MKILITGGTGFIGSALCSRLLEKNHDVILLVRDSNKANATLQTITDLSELDNTTTIDVVINLAGEQLPINAGRKSKNNELLVVVLIRLKI